MTHTFDDTNGAASPGPDLSGAPTQISIDGHVVSVLATLAEPALTVFGNLFTREECEALIASAQPRLARSRTVDRSGGTAVSHESRTSDGMFFTLGETPLIDKLERRIAGLLRWPLERGEGLQVLRYGPGAEYQPHYDFFDAQDAGTATHTAAGGQRIGTLIIYLQSPISGGATTFPQIGLDVAPIQGNAVFFAYPQATPASLTLHAGAPVTAGEKWIATKWLRVRRYA
ncbi:2-oxoglutarate-dependent dioxygenase [Pigmentiphaga aceris]|uniref:2-oxoglutarate-dependent dioxygenase n=1 Tax=Pigmentiphaga aceris TaxID=1940612 RepID=A0A5C0AWW8_9BURK|nr:2OG-Fe(II) oxygenase [Pigmentiphaga aceris]QEI06962.1 2-oxoglutarate-dependent dioxygenase [Pigmentiphaga aceris]